MGIRLKTIISISSLFIALSIGCSQNTSLPPQSSENIFSDRGLGLTPEILVVQLFVPPLLESSVTPGNVSAILKEQADFEQELMRISRQIKVIYRYHYTINGMALALPGHLVAEVHKLVDAKTIETAHPFEKPKFSTRPLKDSPATDKITSVSFIGAHKLHEKGITGEGVSVGIIDTGIDYTHSMLGGSGKVSDYKQINPDLPTHLFPNHKVVGGIDLAGSRFTGKWGVYDELIPQPDSNPIDEAGHGTHVAGTVAGTGDGVHTYSGVAPDAKLHAIKVFGKDGGTFDAIVIAGFEYAMDPNGDFDTSDRLDVLNLSLGGGYGPKQILYSKAISNLSKSGMMVVASAGNSGPIQNIVGAPGTAEQALSVAASIDGREINWRFPTVQFDLPSGKELIAEFAEGNISIPLSEYSSLKGKLVDIGKAEKDLSQEQKDQLRGHVALIERGLVTFVDKLQRAKDAGAIGVIVYNNDDSPPIAMGSADENTKPIELAAVMISKKAGQEIAQALKDGDVIVDFKNDDLVDKPELIDTITEFSSRGPRTDDYGFKPEITAPGQQILSAKVGSGKEGALNNGTSMAAPHIAGGVALLKQIHPTLSPQEIKSLLMNTSHLLSTNGQIYSYSSQGAGRVQVDKAIEADFVSTSSLSFELVEVPMTKPALKTLKLKNISSEFITVELGFSGKELSLALPKNISLNPGEEKDIPIALVVNPGEFNREHPTHELNGTITLQSSKSTLTVPVMVFRSQRSKISLHEQSISDSKAQFKFKNESEFPGTALLFNLIETDEKKIVLPGDEWKSSSCDLQSTGYRMYSAEEKLHIQFAFQVHDIKTHIKHCDFSVLIDGDQDGNPDQELIAISSQSVYGFQEDELYAVILDYKKAQEIRKEYEIAALLGETEEPDFKPAAIASGEIGFFKDSGLIMIDFPLDPLQVDGQKLQVKMAAINNLGEAIERDDYLGSDEEAWRSLNVDPSQLGLFGAYDLKLEALEEKSLSIEKGNEKQKLVIYSPSNQKELEAQGF